MVHEKREEKKKIAHIQEIRERERVKDRYGKPQRGE
jgi:hypothetical protein